MKAKELIEKVVNGADPKRLVEADEVNVGKLYSDVGSILKHTAMKPFVGSYGTKDTAYELKWKAPFGEGDHFFRAVWDPESRPNWGAVQVSYGPPSGGSTKEKDLYNKRYKSWEEMVSDKPHVLSALKKLAQQISQ